MFVLNFFHPFKLLRVIEEYCDIFEFVCLLGKLFFWGGGHENATSVTVASGKILLASENEFLKIEKNGIIKTVAKPTN